MSKIVLEKIAEAELHCHNPRKVVSYTVRLNDPEGEYPNVASYTATTRRPVFGEVDAKVPAEVQSDVNFFARLTRRQPIAADHDWKRYREGEWTAFTFMSSAANISIVTEVDPAYTPKLHVGWSNYATWAIATYIDNDARATARIRTEPQQRAYQLCVEQAENGDDQNLSLAPASIRSIIASPTFTPLTQDMHAELTFSITNAGQTWDDVNWMALADHFWGKR